MALLDAIANSISVPLWRLFGGASNAITTDITVRFQFKKTQETMFRITKSYINLLIFSFILQIPMRYLQKKYLLLDKSQNIFCFSL